MALSCDINKTGANIIFIPKEIKIIPAPIPKFKSSDKYKNKSLLKTSKVS